MEGRVQVFRALLTKTGIGDRHLLWEIKISTKELGL